MLMAVILSIASWKAFKALQKEQAILSRIAGAWSWAMGEDFSLYPRIEYP